MFILLEHFFRDPARFTQITLFLALNLFVVGLILYFGSKLINYFAEKLLWVAAIALIIYFSISHTAELEYILTSIKKVDFGWLIEKIYSY